MDKQTVQPIRKVTLCVPMFNGVADKMSRMVYVSGKNNIYSIEIDQEIYDTTGKIRVKIFIGDQSGVYLWKLIEGVPIEVEFSVPEHFLPKPILNS